MSAGKYDGAVDMDMQSGAKEYNLGAVVQGDEHLLGRSVMYVDIAMIEPDLRQFRKVFGEIDELAESIRQDGLLQPLLVKPAAGGTGRWQIVAGERRWRAAQKAGLTKVPFNILEKTAKSDELAFTDNIQRSSLSKLEIYQAIREFTLRGMKPRAILVMLGKTSNSYISKAVRVADFAENAIIANFVTFPELSQKMEGVTLNNLYEIARLADDDMTLAITTLEKIAADDLSARAAGEYIDNIRARMSEPKPEPAPVAEPVADSPAEPDFTSNPVVDVTAPVAEPVADSPAASLTEPAVDVSALDSEQEPEPSMTEVAEEASPAGTEQNPDPVEELSPEEAEWAAEVDTGVLDDSSAIPEVSAAPNEDDGSMDAPASATIIPTAPAAPVNVTGEQWSYRTVKNLLDDATRLMTQIEKVQSVNIFVGDRTKNNQVVRELIDSLLPRVKTLPQSLSQLRDKFTTQNEA